MQNLTNLSSKQFDPYDDPDWRSRLSMTFLALLIVWPLWSATEFEPARLFDRQSLQATWHFISAFFPPKHDQEFLLLLLEATWQTIAMATAGLILAFCAAFPLSLVINQNLSISLIAHQQMGKLPFFLRQLVRWVLVFLRSMPELVWALLLVRIVGLGATAGVIAIALTYCGMLGKVYAEILESHQTQTSRILLINGSSRLSAFFFASLPEAASELVSYTIYRWECAIRGSVVMGFVGAGGLGQRMDESMKMLEGAEVSSMLIIFVLLVGLADLSSHYFRKILA